jgi:uncharacterized integral membrane protein
MIGLRCGMARFVGLFILLALWLAINGKAGSVKHAFNFVESQFSLHPSLFVFAAAAIGCLLGYLAGRYRSNSNEFGFQNAGEAMLSRALAAQFRSPDYHLMNHVTLRINEGTTQVDHILVSRFGVFVIETKHYKGWIFGNAQDPYWTQVLFKFRSRFQNPIHQNALHVRAVRGLLDFLPGDTIRSMVVFAGDSIFKTDLPEGVFRLNGACDFIASHREEIISLNRVQFCVGRLETARLAITETTDVEHIERLQRRHGRFRDRR